MPDHDEDDDDLGLGAITAPRSYHSFVPRDTPASDPGSQVGWPPTLPLEIALGDGTPKEICAVYGIGRDEWNQIRTNQHFINEVGRMLEELRVDGMGFRVRARMQATEMLKESWRLVHDAATPHNVKAQLIIHTVKVAGLDASRDQGQNAAGGGTAVSIVLNLG